MTVMSLSSDSSLSSTNNSTGGQSKLSASDSKLEMLSFLADLCRTGESVPLRPKNFGSSV